jgi:parvulin-like peptidyl-prolyl isomerase
MQFMKSSSLTSIVFALVLVASSTILPAQDSVTGFSARHILIGYEGAARSQATRTKEEAKEIADQIAEVVKADPSLFGREALDKSEGPSAPEGGFLGIFQKGQMVAPFQEAVESVDPGGVAGPVETQFGYHIIQRLAVPAETKKLAVIVVAYGEVAQQFDITRSQEEAEARANEAAGKIAGGASFEDVAKEYSDAPNGALGGYIGEVSIGVRNANALVIDKGMVLDPGGVSDVFNNHAAYFIVKQISDAEAAAIEDYLSETVNVNAIHLRYAEAMNASEGETRTKQEAQGIADEIKAKTTSIEDFENFAVQFSDEKAERDRRGRVGEIRRGALPPDWAEELFAMEDNAVTSFETPEGIIVMQKVAAEAEASEEAADESMEMEVVESSAEEADSDSDN